MSDQRPPEDQAPAQAEFDLGDPNAPEAEPANDPLDPVEDEPAQDRAQPRASEPAAPEPGASEPEGSQPETSESETTESDASARGHRSRSPKPEAAEAEAEAEAEAAEPVTSESETVEPESTEPESTEPEAGELVTGNLLEADDESPPLAAAASLDAADDDAPFEDLLRERSSTDVALDQPEPTGGPDTADEAPAPPPPAVAPAAEPSVEAVPPPGRAELPTSWPEPIPVGAAEAAPPSRFEGATATPPALILAGAITLAFLLFVTIEPTPRWLLLFVAIIAVLGADGVLRQAWPRHFGRQDEAADSTPYLFLPALAAIAWPMIIEHNVRGYLVLPAALLAGAAFWAMLVAQLSSVRVEAPVYPLARLASTGAVYFTAFALFSLSYLLDAELPAAIAAVAVVAAMLGVELFREGQVDPLETLIFAGVTGILLAEARWAMYYIPVGGYLAGLTLLLAFFLVTGLLHSHLTRRLSSVVTLEYAGIGAAGILLVVVAAQAGLG